MQIRYKYTGPLQPLKPPLQITSEIALWLMRMVFGEGGRTCSTSKAAALLWAIVNRWHLWPGAKRYPNFVSLMRGFSQPINPRWLPGGDLAVKYKNNPAASPERLARRVQICSQKTFPTVIVDAVNAFSVGSLAYPHLQIERTRISNWASLKSTPKNFPLGQMVNGDWFFEDENLRDGRVEVEIAI